MDETARVLINGMNAFLGGGQTYLINLLQELPRAQVFLLVPPELTHHFENRPGLTLLQVGHWNSNPATRFVWENFVLPTLIRKLNIDVYYSAGGLLPFVTLPCKTVSAFRNMLPFSEENRRKFPLGYKRVRYALLKFALSRSFQKADAVIFISRFAQQVIDQVLPRRAGRSAVIYHGIAEQYRRADSHPLARPTRVPPEYVLYVSILNVYKSHLEVVDAWAELRPRS